MAAVGRASAVIDVEEVQTGFASILTELETDPDMVFGVSREQESAAIILHPATYNRLIEAAETILDLDEAEIALASEPLESFADCHAQRMARRRQAGS